MCEPKQTKTTIWKFNTNLNKQKYILSKILFVGQVTIYISKCISNKQGRFILHVLIKNIHVVHV